MESTTTDFKAIPIPVDHDARNLAIVFGSLGALIAFANLIFAILSWMRSRHQRLAAQHRTSDDVELGVNTPRDTVRTPQESQNLESSTPKYASTNNRSDGDAKLTWHSYHLQTTSTLPAIDTTQPQFPFELEGAATMPPRPHESSHTTESTNATGVLSSAPVVPRRT
jgi:hypothetical protein